MLLETEKLSVQYRRKGQVIPALRGISFGLESGETLGIAGESGCGKSSLALAILRLIAPYEGSVSGRSLRFNGEDLLAASEERLREIRGKDIGIIFQDPFSSLNPVMRIGDQIAEGIAVHQPVQDERALRARVLELLGQVRIGEPERIYSAYPHQVSGGQRQRALIALAIANRPKLLIADEPTTALDATVQKEILDLLAALQKELGMAVILITHHLGLIARYTRRILVLYAGEIAEEGKTAEVIANPQHPYTQSLLKSLPGRGTRKGRKSRLATIPGAPPDPAHLPAGCPFHPRCPFTEERCRSEAPSLRPLENLDRRVTCHWAPFPPGVTSPS